MGKSWDTFDKDMFGKKGEEGANDLKVKKNFNILPRYGNADLMGFQDFIAAAFIEAIRVLKPGGHALVWAIPRTSHHTAMGLERAGFEIRDIVNHIFGSGFPKSLNLGKAVDKLQGNERKKYLRTDGKRSDSGSGCYNMNSGNDTMKKEFVDTKGNSPYEGWGTALKPASEHWILCRKPISEKNVALNVLKWGVGGINIDGCRVEAGTEHMRGNVGAKIEETDWKNKSGFGKPFVATDSPLGRFPANLILSCTCDEVIVGNEEIVKIHDAPSGSFAGGTPGRGSIKNYRERTAGHALIHTNPLCPCYILDRQSGNRKGWSSQKHNTFNPYGGNALLKSETIREGYYEGFNDTGGASRFFYCPKASKSERNMGCENLDDKSIGVKGNGLGRVCEFCGVSQLKPELCRCEVKSWINPVNNKNNHPTVKSLSLMRYLCRLICPPNGIILDPFAGSGSTLIAAKLNKFNFIGIEKDPEYHKIAVARLKAYKYSKQENLF